MDKDRLELTKKTAIDFYDLMFNKCRPADAIAKYVDIFGFDDAGRIVENWDLLQVVPETSVSQNTMF